MHINPLLNTKGLIVLYNPLKEKMTRTIKIPMYYTGLKETALISEKGGSAVKYTLSRDYMVELSFSIEPEGFTWFIIQ